MSKVKKDLLKEIDDKMAKKKALRKEMAKRKDDLETYVLGLMGDLEDVSVATVGTSYYNMLIGFYAGSIEAGIRTNYDANARANIVWADTLEGEPKRLNGVIIKWSLEYQTANKCDPERYIDILSLLLK